MTSAAQSETQKGIFYGVCAYIMWGLAPLYFKQLAHVPAFEILTHRVVWSILLLFLLLGIFHKFGEFKIALKSPRRLLVLLIASTLLAVNWLIYIWAVNEGRILEASLGYYINPLLNVLLGAIFLKERLRPLQYVAVGLVVIGVTILLIGFGAFPWIAFSLAISFGIYGLLRKMVSVGPLPGLTLETAFMFPVAIVYLLFFSSEQSNLVANTAWNNSLLIGLGVLTTAPLLAFNAAAKRLMYSTIGFLQYIGPTIMFVLAVLVYDEAFTLERVVIFGFVWAGVILFSMDSLRSYRTARHQRKASSHT
jgi:chloramphenicol-sensitive protein RarD